MKKLLFLRLYLQTGRQIRETLKMKIVTFDSHSFSFQALSRAAVEGQWQNKRNRVRLSRSWAQY